MIKKNFQGKPVGYKITYYPVDMKSNFKSASVNYTINSTTLTDLAVHTMYAIQVSAVSSGGVGPGKNTSAATGGKALILSWLVTGLLDVLRFHCYNCRVSCLVALFELFELTLVGIKIVMLSSAV